MLNLDLNDSNMTGAQAAALFSDKAFNLGALAASGELGLTITLTVQSDKAGSGFYGDFIVGDPPSHDARLHNFITAVAGMLAPDGMDGAFQHLAPQNMESAMLVAHARFARNPKRPD